MKVYHYFWKRLYLSWKKHINMVKLGYNILGTFMPPDKELELAKKVEEAGFEYLMIPDHFLPWYHTDAETPHAWVLASMALERTDRINIGTFVTAPTFRYHPVTLAQAFGTLENVHPGRIFLGVGTGEKMNERPFIDRWPDWNERSAMLEEAISLVRKLWREPDYFDFNGSYFKINDLHLYTRPRGNVPIFYAALGPKGAYNAGRLAEGLITFGGSDRLGPR